MIEVKHMVIVYRIKSEGYPPVQKKITGLAQLESIFYERYLLAEAPEEKLKYLRYFNHVVHMRNRLEFGLPTE
jgi:hypothetical protein